MGITNTSQLNRPVYTVDAGASFDTTLWPVTVYQTPDGHPLYFYGGDSTASEGVVPVPAGDGADGVWHVYSGDLVDTTGAAAAKAVAEAGATDQVAGLSAGQQDPTAAAPSSTSSSGVPDAAAPTDTAGAAAPVNPSPSPSSTSGDPGAGEPAHVEIDGEGNAQAVPAGTAPLPPSSDPGNLTGTASSVPPLPGIGNGGTLVTGDGSGPTASPQDTTGVPAAAEGVSAAVDRLKGRLHDLADGVSGELKKIAGELEDLAGNI